MTIQRKSAHIELTPQSQVNSQALDSRFDYEPLFFTHPSSEETWSQTFLGQTLNYPLWISSMTGGTESAKSINENLARLCGKYKLGMGLGSCRSILESNDRLKDFSVRRYLGDQPFFANLGLAQIEELVAGGRTNLVTEMLNKIEATGLIIHINPLQEWLQPEGDRYKVSPLQTLQKFLELHRGQVIVKEVGQGMGPKSIKALLELPIAGIELGAFGGTNFTLLESLRVQDPESKKPFISVGHTAYEMVDILNALPIRNKEIIISGGIKTILDGYALKSTLKAPSVIGMAQAYLAPAMAGFDELEHYFLGLRESLLTARGLLAVKGNE
jgi:isopentenyl-diphosphate delta-isomerase